MNIICWLFSHERRRWKIKNPHYDKNQLPCTKGISTETKSYGTQVAHHPRCPCEFLDFYICKRCGKDLTLWINSYKPNPEDEYIEVCKQLDR